MWYHVNVLFVHETSINSERFQIQSIFSHFSHSGHLSLKKGILCKALPFFWVTYVVTSKTDTQIKYAVSLSVCACFMREWNPEMMSQSKLDPFYCIAVHGPKKGNIWRKNQCRGKNLFHQSSKSSSKSLLMWKKNWRVVLLNNCNSYWQKHWMGLYCCHFMFSSGFAGRKIFIYLLLMIFSALDNYWILVLYK